MVRSLSSRPTSTTPRFSTSAPSSFITGRAQPSSTTSSSITRTSFLISPRSRPSFITSCAWCPIADDRKSTRLNSSHVRISYAVFCLKKKKKKKKPLLIKKKKKKTKIKKKKKKQS